MRHRKHMHKVLISDFYCQGCGANFPLPRTGNQREKGHIKDLWCPYCKAIMKFTEVRHMDFKCNVIVEGGIDNAIHQ